MKYTCFKFSSIENILSGNKCKICLFQPEICCVRQIIIFENFLFIKNIFREQHLRNNTLCYFIGRNLIFPHNFPKTFHISCCTTEIFTQICQRCLIILLFLEHFKCQIKEKCIFSRIFLADFFAAKTKNLSLICTGQSTFP